MELRKILYLIGVFLSAGVGIYSILNHSLPNAFLPFAVTGVSLVMMTGFPGILKGAIAQGLIAAGSLLTGLFIGSNPLFIPGLGYFLLSTSLPLAIISFLDFQTFFKIKHQGEKERE